MGKSYPSLITLQWNMYGERFEGMLSDVCDAGCGFGGRETVVLGFHTVDKKQGRDVDEESCRNREQLMQGAAVKEY